MTGTRERLLAAAADSLRFDGADALSARVIAARAGANQALVFYHFGSVDQLVDEAVRAAVAESRERYAEALAGADSFATLVTTGRRLHEQESSVGNVAMMAQLMAAGQHRAALAATARAALALWAEAIEPTVSRVLAGSLLGRYVDAATLTRSISAAFLGFELVDGVDPQHGRDSLELLDVLARMADRVDALGPVPKRAVAAGLTRGRRRTT